MAVQKAQVEPWLPLLMVAAAATVWSAGRRPLLLIGLVGTVAPFAVALDGAVRILAGEPRFLANAMPFVPVLIGVGFAVIARGSLARRATPASRKGAAWAWLGVGLFLAATIGLIPSWLGPTASWRRPLRAMDGGPRKYELAALGYPVPPHPAGAALHPDCLAATRAEIAAGGPHLVRFDPPSTAPALKRARSE